MGAVALLGMGVVPPSWIISSVEESSLAAALREVGILDDSQALWSMVFPTSELRSIQALPVDLRFGRPVEWLL
eukprot:s4514_g2.t1